MPSPERKNFEQFINIEDEKFNHDCGIIGFFDPSNEISISRETFFGLYSLQHRGQESVGIAVSDGKQIKSVKKMGLVASLTENDIADLEGFISIGHTRYSNTGGGTLANAQPVIYGPLALSQNGNLVNPEAVRKYLELKGIYPSRDNQGNTCSSDGELLAQAIVSSNGKNWVEKIQKASEIFNGAYSLTIVAEDKLFGVKDPLGFWPLCLGSINSKGYVLASETCALGTVGAKFIRELEPGEIVEINKEGIKSHFLPGSKEGMSAACAFDPNYFLRPDSLHLGNERVSVIRKRLGRQLAVDQPVDADVVVSVPDSGEFGAIGYAAQSGIPLEVGFIKNKYIGRTFIMTDQRIREIGVSLKLSPLPEVFEGKRVVLVDDSAVRGTNSILITEMLFLLGAKEVHWRFTFPQITDPCFVGIDMARRSELVGAGRTVREVCQKIGATSVGFNSIDGFISAVGTPKDKLCTGCITGHYPIEVPYERNKFALEVTS